MPCGRCGSDAPVEWTYVDAAAFGRAEIDELDLCASCRDELAKPADVDAQVELLEELNQQLVAAHTRLCFSDDERARFWSGLQHDAAGVVARSILDARRARLNG